MVIPLTLLFISVLLYMNTRSFTKTCIVLLAVPFSAIGAVWFLYLLDYNMSIGVWVGLIALLGVDAEALGFREEEGFHNVDKIRGFQKPTLIIHAERDHIIPFSDGQALYDASPAREKTLLKIPGANHNDIFMRGFSAYMEAMKALMEKVKAS